MSYASPDRWTCPTCGTTEVPLDTGDDVALALAIRLVQVQHAERHDARRRELEDHRRAVLDGHRKRSAA